MFSTPAIYRTVLSMVADVAPHAQGDYLDLGAGTGDLIRLMRERHPHLRAFACDYSDRLMEQPDVAVQIADLNQDKLPYEDNRFALVTCTETVEHLERYREAVREVFRVLRPGGWAVFSTPNILNLKSRLRFLAFGFWNLFGPLAVRESAMHDTGGHINPVSFFYLAHSLLDAGFGSDLRVRVDRWQRSSLVPLVLLYAPIRAAAALMLRQEIVRFKTVDAHNIGLVRRMNSLDLLLGRTLVVAARKPPVAAGQAGSGSMPGTMSGDKATP